MIPAADIRRTAGASSIGSQNVFWSVLNGFTLPKGVFDFVEDGDLVRVLTHRLFLSEIQSRNPTVMAFLQDKVTLIRLPRILFGQSPLDSTLGRSIKEKLVQDEQTLKLLEADNENVRSEAAQAVVQTFSAFENTTDFIEHYLTKEMLPHLLYLSYANPYEREHAKAVRLQFLMTSFASIIKSIFQKDNRYKRFFDILPTIEGGYTLKRLINFAPHPAIEDILVFMSMRRLKNPDFESGVLKFLDKWKPLSYFASVLVDKQALSMPPSYLDSCKNFFVQFCSQKPGPLSTSIILSKNVQTMAKHISHATTSEQLGRLAEVWLCIVGQCIFKIQNVASMYCTSILEKLQAIRPDLDSAEPDGAAMENQSMHITIPMDVLASALENNPSPSPLPSPEMQALFEGSHGEQLLNIAAQEAQHAGQYISVVGNLLGYISTYTRQLRTMLQKPVEISDVPFSLLLEYAKFFARIASIPAAMKAYIYDFSKGCGPISEFNGVGPSGEMYLSLDGSQYADLPETAAASSGGTSEVSLKETVFLQGLIRLPCSAMDVVEALDTNNVPSILLDLLTTYDEGRYVQSSTLAFYVFRIFKVLLAYSKFNSDLVPRIFQAHKMESLILELSREDVDKKKRVLLPFVRDFVLSAYRLAAGIPDAHAYMHKKRHVFLRNDSSSGQGRAFVPEAIAQVEEMVCSMEDANMSLLLYLQESPVIRSFNDTHCLPLLKREMVFYDGTDSASKKRCVADQSVIDSLTASLQALN